MCPVSQAAHLLGYRSCLLVQRYYSTLLSIALHAREEDEKDEKKKNGKLAFQLKAVVGWHEKK